MEPINLKKQYGERYRIGHDEAADFEPDGKQNSWLYTIPCRYGHIYPHSDQLLAVFCDSPRMFAKLEAIHGVRLHQEGDAEAVFVFPMEAFDRVAVVMLAKKKRRLSITQREEAIERLQTHRFRSKTTQPSA